MNARNERGLAQERRTDSDSSPRISSIPDIHGTRHAPVGVTRHAGMRDAGHGTERLSQPTICVQTDPHKAEVPI